MIGGGLAGLAASVALAETGWRVRLFEQRPFLGGRAASYVLPDGEHIDNCQHVTFGCCTNLEDFYRRVGSAGHSGLCGGSRNSSAIPRSAGSWRTGLHAEKMLSGTTMVRVQLDMA